MSFTPEIIFFDAFGTLIYLPASVGAHYREIGLHHGMDVPADALDRAFRARWRTAPPRVNTTDGPRPEDDKGWWRELVRGVITDVSPNRMIEGFDFTAYFDELYGHFARPGVWAAFPEVPGVLTALKKRGFRLGVISNFDRRLYQILDGLGLGGYFDPVIISSEVGADKPEPRIFQTALRLAGVGADAAVHVGDDPERDWGAEAVGMSVYKFHRPERSLDGLAAWLDARSAPENELAS